MVQDINGPGNKEVSLANFHIPKISRSFRAPLLEPSSLEPNVGAFQKEVCPKLIFKRLGCSGESRYCPSHSCTQKRTQECKGRRKAAKARLARQEKNRNEISFSLFICCCFIFCPMAGSP
uniref:Uncharacterized protein n=1 Tax=Romanomermis culicivorax TaxID=13658 RepID=A0A915J6L8_ROMCU